MKRILLGLVASATMFTGFAEGYQVNTLSAKQVGMAHVGAGMKLGAESMYFNPAGMAFMDKTLDLSVGVTGISSYATCTYNNNEYKTSNPVSTPMFAYAAFSIYDNLKAGVSLTTPYGSGINWGENWPGAVLNQSCKLATYSIQPTISWRITPRLSVGAGLMIAWGSVDLNKGLVSASSMDFMLAATHLSDYRFIDVTPASVNLKGTAKGTFGLNIGAMYDITNDLTVGASYRTKMMATVSKGDATVTYANEVAEAVLQNSVGVLNNANFSAEMPMISVLTFGASYRPTKRWQVAFDAQLNFWSAYKNLYIDFLTEKLAPLNQDLTKNYDNAWAFRLGTQYALTDRFDIRAGISYDCTPVKKDFLNPETPGTDKISPSVGLSFRPTPKISVDVAFAYIAGLNRNNVSYTYTDLIYKSMDAQLKAQGVPNGVEQLGKTVEQTMTADYKVHAITPSIGVSYSF